MMTIVMIDVEAGKEDLFERIFEKYEKMKNDYIFKKAKLFSSFAGLYAKNTLDGQPVVFEENGIIVVGGTSGSGIMKADAVGRIAAALYAGQEYAALFGGEKFKVSDLGLEERKVEPERLII